MKLSYSFFRKHPKIFVFIFTVGLIGLFYSYWQKSAVQNSPTPTSSVQTNLFKVAKAIDGDTIELEGGQKIRYIGINTPETTLGKNDCFGKVATEKNKELVEGKSVRLEKDVSETDKYGRLLRFVYVDDVFVNDYLVRQGYANVDTFPPDIKLSGQFKEAAREARENNRGLWGSCPLDQIKGATANNTDKDCSDFKTQKEAQDYFLSKGGPEKDPDKLDSDHDGKVCVSLP